MRLFHQLVFDGYVAGSSGNVYSDCAFDELLGSADQLSIGGYSAMAIGPAGVQLTVQVEQSFDQDEQHWLNRNTTPEIASTNLSTTGQTTFAGRDGDLTTRVTLGYARLRIALNGSTTPSAQVRIWVTGRSMGEP